MKYAPTFPALLVLASAGIGTGHAAVIAVTGGSVNGFQNLPPFFDAQPTTTPTAGTTTDNFGAAGDLFTTAGRAYYFDFGPNFASVTLTQVFLGLKQFGTTPTAPTAADFYWSPTVATADATYDPGGRGHVAATGAGAGATTSGVGGSFNIFNYAPTTSDQSWLSIWTGSVVPQSRYYVASFSGTGDEGNRIQEIVFIGAVPEPSALLLSSLGLLPLLRRKR